MRAILFGTCVLAALFSCTASAGVHVEGGLVVCIGDHALESVAAQWRKPGYVIHCLVTSAKDAEPLRRKIRDAKCYGKVSVASFDGQHLPYTDNLVNTIIVSDKRSAIPATEVQRVLAPYGTATAPRGAMCLPQPVQQSGASLATYTKPYPDNMDEWPQYLHGADNNCVAEDTVVGPPRHVQWISTPAWTRAHIGAATISSMVSSGGRLFTIEDRATAENPLLPAQWKLIARNAFNGIVLWTMDYPTWEQVTVYIKNFHAQMQRRLVAIGDTVYCTPGLTAPVTALNAATGAVLRKFPETERTQEFVYHDGLLYAVIGDRMSFDSYRGFGARTGRKRRRTKSKSSAAPAADPGLAFNGNGFRLSLYNPRTRNASNPTCAIAAFDAATGRAIWRSKNIDHYIGCTLALKHDKLVYQSAHGVTCLNAKTGAKNWSVEKSIPYGVGNRPDSLVLSDKAVYSEEGSAIHAYALSDGSNYWPRPIAARKGYQASTDLLIAAGALWMCGTCNNPRGTVLKKPTSFDLETGNELKTIPQILSKPMGHDRCFRNFITTRFFVDSKTGGPDCMDLITGAEFPAPFTRGTCSMGPVPCNGLFYCGPYACQCHLPVALHDFNAYCTDESSLTTKGQVVQVKRRVRLEQGPIYGWTGGARTAPWPTYRQDNRRYAHTPRRVPATDLRRTWRVRFQHPATAPIIAENTVFTAETDAHVLRALDAATGKTKWQYVAGGRIDSPPTYYKGLLLFGSCDGSVYCVRAADGVLSWRFRDLPDKLICAFNQLESAWPVHGSILMKNDTAYFCAGRSTYLDGGLFIYGLDPVTGEIRYQRQYYGPYGDDGFPEFVTTGNRSETEKIKGTTADVMSCEGDTLYIRQQAFHLDLSDAAPGLHLMASAGMLETHREHREYKLVSTDFNNRKTWTSVKTPYPTGDIIVADGTDYYSVFGMPVTRGEMFNARNGYTLTAKTRQTDGWHNKWTLRLPLTGKDMLLAADTVFVAGAPLTFPSRDPGATYAGRLGGVLWAVSAGSGQKLAEYKLDVLPAWDAMAAADGSLVIVNQDGSIDCWSRDN